MQIETTGSGNLFELGDSYTNGSTGKIQVFTNSRLIKVLLKVVSEWRQN